MFASQEQINQIIDLYNTGLSAQAVANKLSITKRVVLLRLKSAGVKRRSTSEAVRKYDLNEQFFDTIDSEAKAYWLGFMLADGNIGHTGRYGKARQLRCTLQRRDKKHLAKFLTSLNSDHKVYDIMAVNRATKKKYPASIVRVTSKRLCEPLERLGWREFKTRGETRILDSTCDTLKPHLIRGLVDGDGWICFSGNRWIFGYCDLHKPIVEWVKSWIAHGNPRVTQPKNNKSYRIMYTGSEQVPSIIDRLYNNSSIALDRKASLAAEVLAHRQSWLSAR